MSNSRFIDEQTILDLKELLADNFETLVTTFISDGVERIERLSIAIREGNMELVRMESHALKGSSRNFGAEQYAQQCALVEQQARNNDEKNIERRFVDQKTDFRKVCEELKCFL